MKNNNLTDHVPAIYAAIRKYANESERRDEDFVSDVLVFVVEKFGKKYDPLKSTPTTYIFLLVSWGIWLVRKKAARAYLNFPPPLSFNFGDSGKFGESSYDPGYSPENHEPDTMAALRGELARLPPKWGLAVDLHILQGMTLAETGTILGVSRERVRQLVESGLDKMRWRMAGH